MYDCFINQWRFYTFLLCVRPAWKSARKSTKLQIDDEYASGKADRSGVGDKLNVTTIFERRTLFLFLGNTYLLYRKDSNPLLWFSQYKYPWTRLFPRKTFTSLVSNMGAPSYTVDIATDGIDNWSTGEASISSASRHLTSKCQVRFIYIEHECIFQYTQNSNF